MVTKNDLKAAREAHDAALQEAERIREEADRRRAQVFTQANTEGIAQKEIIEATGYSRETVRRILNPQAVEAAKKRRAAKSGGERNKKGRY